MEALTRRAVEAVEIVAEIARNRDTNPATRLQACQTLINNAQKYVTAYNPADNTDTLELLMEDSLTQWLSKGR